MAQGIPDNHAEHAAASKERASQIKNMYQQPWFRWGVPALIIIVVVGGFIWWKIASSQVYIENSAVTAPVIELSPQNSGVLQQTYVQEGDAVAANTVVARVDNELVKTKTAGQITYVDDAVGTLLNRGTVVVRMIQPEDLR